MKNPYMDGVTRSTVVDVLDQHILNISLIVVGFF